MKQYTCGLCQYYRINPEDITQGICRKNPPKGFPVMSPGPIPGKVNIGTATCWPAVHGQQDWCGEYHPRISDA